jgi:signal transduction histidine kinase
MAGDIKRLDQLVSRLLELARADLSEPSMQQSSILPVLEELRTRYKPKGLDVQLIALQELPTVHAASDNLEAIFGHLLENSLQAGATEIQISTHMTKDALVFQVQDNGPGISEGNQQNLFTPFFTTKRNSGGSGLGLVITRSLLEALGGNIRLILQETGTCFRIHLPIP